MELDKFISATLVQIAHGVKMANDELEPNRVKESGENENQR